MSKRDESQKRLTLKRETLRTLTATELRLVAGGIRTTTYTCGC